MVHPKEYIIDVTLFQSLNHEELAQHVIPDTFVGSGDNAYAARKECAEKVVEYFKRNVLLNVKLASKNWKTKHFGMMVGRKVLTKPVAVARCNLATSTHCILYCKDCCDSEEKKCSPIAKVLFGSVGKNKKKSKVSGTVEWLFFHNCHDWKLRNETLCLAGCCLIPTPVDFITQGTYQDSFAAARELLHSEKGVLDGSELGVKKEVPEKELPFEYIRREYPRNFAYMPFSNENADNWQKKKARHAFQKFVDPAAHQSCIVRLFYCVSNLIGLGSIATPFEYEYDERMKVVGSVRNRKHNLFAQEESVVVGGFVYGKEKENQIRHTAHDNVSMHRPFNPLINNGQDAGSCHKYGFAVITSLLRGEERVVYAGRNDAEIVIPYNMSMVLLGNFPHGGVTHCVNQDCDSVWPALYAYLDMFSRPRCPFITGDVPSGYGTLDSDEELADSVSAVTDAGMGSQESDVDDATDAKGSDVDGGGNTEDEDDAKDDDAFSREESAADAGMGSQESDVDDATDAKGSDVDGGGNTEDEDNVKDDDAFSREEAAADAGTGSQESDVDDATDVKGSDVDGGGNTEDEDDAKDDDAFSREESVCDSEADGTSESSSNADEDEEQEEEDVDNEESRVLLDNTFSDPDSDPEEADHVTEQECSSEEETASAKNVESEEEHGPKEETYSDMEDAAEQINESIDEHGKQQEFRLEEQDATEQNLESDIEHSQTCSDMEEAAQQIAKSKDEHVNQQEIPSEEQDSTEQTSAPKKRKRNRERKQKQKSAVSDTGKKKKKKK